MALYLKGELLNIYKSNDYTDKKTGEVQVGSHRLQIQELQKMQDGSQKVEITELATDNVTKYQASVGKEITVMVDYYAFLNNGKLISGLREL